MSKPASRKKTKKTLSQKEIDHYQELYQKWLKMVPKLEKAQKEWQKADKLLTPLKQFYFEGRWQDYFEAMKKDLKINTITSNGSYHIMEEDTLWDAFADQDELAWSWLRLALQILDPKNSP